MSKPEITQRIPELDGLRGLAIAMVMYFHCIVERPANYSAPLLWFNRTFGSLAWSGVDLFFVLSGFLIGGILIDAKSSSSYFRTFYLRRAFRIIPLYALILILYLAIRSAGPDLRELVNFLAGRPMPWYVYATFTQDLWQVLHRTQRVFLEHSWSLSVEEQFYLTLPLAIYFTPRRHLATLTACLAVTAIASRSILYGHGYLDNAQMMYFPTCRADALLIGVGCALAVRNDSLKQLLSRRPEFLYMGFGAAVLSICALMATAAGSPPAMMLTVIALAFACLLLVAVLHPAAIFCSVLRFRPLRALGTIAYGTYLVHVIVRNAFHQFLIVQIAKRRITSWSSAAFWSEVGSEFAVSIAIAAFSWFVLEKHCIQFSRRWTYTFDASAVAPE